MVKGVISHFRLVMDDKCVATLERNTFSVRLSGRTFFMKEDERYMYTENCMYCDKAFEKMKGKLLIQVKMPDDAVPLSKVYISEKNDFFGISLVPGSVFIYDVEKDMDIYAKYSIGTVEDSSEVRIESKEFTHLVVDYDYFYYRNQARVKKVRLKKIEHKNPEEI